MTVTVRETFISARTRFAVIDGYSDGKVLYNNTTNSGAVPSPQTFEITSGRITFIASGTASEVNVTDVTGLEDSIGNEYTGITYKVVSNGTITINVNYDV